MKRSTNRRQFLKETSLSGLGFWVLGASTGAAADKSSPNEKLNVAGIGVGGQGAGDVSNIANQAGVNIVALCDPDEVRAGGTFAKFPKAKRYQDFRKMLEQQKDIDAVVVATPDNVHAVASLMAMRMGKAVYCEKPLTHDVMEARQMRETAKKYKVATQMGNQGTSGGGLRRAAEVIQDGAIGAVKEAHVWTNRPIWPQDKKEPLPEQPVPATMNWQVWLGPAPERPYNKGYAPFNWRGWWDFGTGALGDMACHTMNLPYLALKLAFPSSVVGESSDFNLNACYPTWAKVHYEFPARGSMPAVKLTWYEGRKDGKLVLPYEDLQKKVLIVKRTKRNGKLKGQQVADTNLPGSGSIMVGDKGILYSPDDYGQECFIIRGTEVEQVGNKPERYPQSPGHHAEFVRAAKGGSPAMSNFDYAGMLTETVLLGNVAIRAKGKKLEWDGPNLTFKNAPEALAYLSRHYRSGWQASV